MGKEQAKKRTSIIDGTTEVSYTIIGPRLLAEDTTRYEDVYEEVEVDRIESDGFVSKQKIRRYVGVRKVEPGKK